jgi:Flp pilus assembly protein TadD
MTHQWEEAKSRCDAAIAGARASDADAVFDFGASRDKRLATAYSNRAVFNWLRNQKPAAVADLSKARSLAPKLEFVAQNSLVLNQGSDTTTAPQIASTRP